MSPTAGDPRALLATLSPGQLRLAAAWCTPTRMPFVGGAVVYARSLLDPAAQADRRDWRAAWKAAWRQAGDEPRPLALFLAVECAWLLEQPAVAESGDPLVLDPLAAGAAVLADAVAVTRCGLPTPALAELLAGWAGTAAELLDSAAGVLADPVGGA